MRLSARDQLAGTVVGVVPGAVTTTVKVELSGGDIVRVVDGFCGTADALTEV